MNNERSSASWIAGAKQVKKALLNGRAERVLYGEDADPALVEPLLALCEEKQIPYECAGPMRAVGERCGIEVGAAIAALVRKN